ncbi:MAG TPA: PTS sugar transporter subunit IIA [Elusimicrobiota bacterium]|nr:PTS sugar transporter subunit IIA [Elusimicrobiota bacterium]
MSFEAGKKLENLLPVAALLNEENILPAPAGADKAAVIRLALASLCRTRGLAEEKSIADKILERESGICTTLETGLSLPHARLKGLAAPCAGMVLVPSGIPEPQEPELLIKLVFLFLSPDKQEFFAEHLKILRSAASLLRAPLIDEVASAGSAREALARLKAAEGGRA